MEILNKILEKEEFKKYDKIKDFEIKFYDNSDKEGLMDLYQSIFPGYMSEELWNWKTNKNPYGRFYTILMKEGDKVIASYSVSPKEFYIFGEKYPCVQSMDTMTDKNYWKRGISTYLANLTYEYSKIVGDFFVYGFPNKNSSHLFEIKLKWKNFGKIDLLFKDINPEFNILKSESGFLIKEINKFGNQINEFWNSFKSKFSIIIKKDETYLNWRFNEHPLVKYKKFLVYNAKSDKIVSFFVLKKFHDNMGQQFGHIVDLVIGPQEIQLKKRIFKLIEAHTINLFKEDCTKISFWLMDEILKKMAIDELNYKITQMETNFGYKIFSTNEKLSILDSLKNWHITMANNDVF